MNHEPLIGIRVLDLTRLLPGPLLTMWLGDLGADVIKVEEPSGGDWTRALPPRLGADSAFFAALNRNKRSLALDLKRDAGRELFLRLAKGADVVVEGFRPGVMARLGLGYEALHAANARLIVCSVSGYGQTGPLAMTPGHDLNYQALAGTLGLTAMVDGEMRAAECPETPPPAISTRQSPLRNPHLAQPGALVADVLGGSGFGLASIMTALYHRERTGRGAHLDVAMSEGALAALTPLLAQTAAGEPVASGSHVLTGGAAQYRVYRCSDARSVAVAALEPQFLVPLLKRLDREDLLADLRADGTTSPRMHTELEALFASQPLEYWRELLEGEPLCVNAVRSLEEVLDEPHFVERGMFLAFADREGAKSFGVRCPLRSSEYQPTVRLSAPALGQNSDEVLAEFGIGDQERAALRHAEVIR